MVVLKVKNKEGDWQALTPPKGGFKLQLEIVNPIFNLGEIERVNSFDFSIPLNNVPNNIELLGYLNVIENVQRKAVTIDMLIEWHGFILEGSAVIDKPFKQNASLRAYVIAKGREFTEQIKDKYVADFELGGVRTDAVFDSSLTAAADVIASVRAKMDATVNATPDTSDFVYPRILIKDFHNWEEDKADPVLLTESPLGGAINHSRNSLTEPLIYQWGQKFTGPFSSIDVIDGEAYKILNTIVPMFFIRNVFKEILNELGYTHVYNLFTDVELSKLIIFNVTSLETPEYKTNVKDCITSFINPKNHVPTDLLVKDFITSFQSLFFAILSTNKITKKASFIPIDEILNNNNTIDITQYCLPNPEIGFVDDSIEFELGRNGSETTDKFIDISSVNYKGTVQSQNDLDNHALLSAEARREFTGEVYFAIDENTYFEYKEFPFPTESGIELAAFEYYPIGHGIKSLIIGENPSTKISTKITTLCTHHSPQSYYYGNGNASRFKGNSEGNPYTLLFLRAAEETSGIACSDGSGKGGNYGVRYDGEKGTVENFGQKYLKLITEGREVIYNAWLPSSVLAKLQNWEQPKVTINHVRYVIQQIKPTLDNKELAFTELILMQDV